MPTTHYLLHQSALLSLATSWRRVAASHLVLNLTLLAVLLGAQPPMRERPQFLLIGAWVLSFAALLAVWLVAGGLRVVAAGILAGDGRPMRPAIRALVVAGGAYSLAWIGMTLAVFLSEGRDTHYMAMTLTAMLLCVVIAGVATPAGGLARALVIVQGGSVAIGWLLQTEQPRYFFAPFAFLGTLVALWLMSGRDKEWIAAYRIRRRQARLQQQLQRRNEYLQQISSSKSRMLATASHDLRQPAHALGMLVGSLRGEPAAAPVRDKVEQINEVVEALSDSLRRLLEVARLEAGAVQVQIAPLELDRLLASLHAEFAPVAAAKGIAFSCEARGFHVRSDAVLLRTMLANLTTNALRYTRRGCVRVDAQARQDGKTVRIEVSDTGEGIPAERIPDVFEAFVRLAGADAAAEGLGLGLAITRRTAELLQVPIHVESKVGAGSTFSLDLPLIAAPVHAVAAPPPAASAATLQGLRVVVIDNDPIVLSSVVQAMEDWGCLVIGATGEDELRSKLSALQAPMDLIVADYHLGSGATGLDVIAKLRSLYETEVRAILLTGDVEIKPGDSPASPHVAIAHKPLPPAKLRALVLKLAPARPHLGPEFRA